MGSKAFDADTIEKEIEELIGKRYVGDNLSIISDRVEKDTGFFLIFIKRDSRKGDPKISTRTFGDNMTLEQVVSSFYAAMKNIIETGGSGGPMGFA